MQTVAPRRMTASPLTNLPKNLLIVDDEPDMREGLESLVEAYLPNVHVETAPSGDKALETVRTARFDVILSDFKMPGMDGITFLRECRDLQPHAHRVLATAYADDSLERRAHAEADIELFLTKPLDPTSFVTRLQGLLAAEG